MVSDWMVGLFVAFWFWFLFSGILRIGREKAFAWRWRDFTFTKSFLEGFIICGNHITTRYCIIKKVLSAENVFHVFHLKTH